MALAMNPTTSLAIQDDIMDIDIDMDLDDVGIVAEDDMLEEGEEPPTFVPTGHQAATEEVAAIYLEDPAQEPTWEKLHLRGVDDLSTDNIRTFASDYFSDAIPYVQWVDDTSANLVYKDKTLARNAMLNLVQQPITTNEIQNNPFELRTVKPMVTHPSSIMTVRVAMVGDRKKKDARHASRYYLLHPEVDPLERSRPGRGEQGDYKRRRFDEKEHNKRRQRHQDDTADVTNDFQASMYDDEPAPKNGSKERGRDLFSRITRTRHRSASPTTNTDALPTYDSDDDHEQTPQRRRNGYRNRDSPPPRRQNAGRELFGGGGATDTRSNGAGMRSDNPSLFARRDKQTPSKPSAMTSYEANQGMARQLRADLKAAQTQSPAGRHRRSRAMDSRMDEDLVERFGRKSISLDSTKSVTQMTSNTGKELFASGVDIDMSGHPGGGFSIKGSASQGISIKGRADNVRELFPDRFSTGGGGGGGGPKNGNVGKELFDRLDPPVRNRPSRQRAGDLFD